MSDSIVLACAVLASLAAGVLLAYGVCQLVFRVFAMRAQRPAAKAEDPMTQPVAQPAQTVES